MRKMRDAGIGYLRVDCTWLSVQKEKGGPFDFSVFDAVVDSAEKVGIKIFPILQQAPKWALPQVRHLPEVKAWVKAFVTHYGARIPAFEFWNEENASGFWQGEPNPEDFAEVLKTAYEAVREAGTGTKVVFGGTTGIPLDYFRRAFAHGALQACDAVACHPYVFPGALEGEGRGSWAEESLDGLRNLMEEFGGAKPIWITECGWPTHTVNPDPIGLLATSLKAARPEKSAWNIVYADTVPNGAEPDQTFSRILESKLPKGSKVEACASEKVCRLLNEGAVDAVMYPSEKGRCERYPEETAAAVVDFVRRGGTLVALNGCPMWIGCGVKADGRYGEVADGKGRHLAALRVSLRQQHEISSLPGGLFAVHETEEAVANGYKYRKRGNVFGRVFFDDRLLKSGDRFVPLMYEEDPKTGERLVTTGVYVFDSDMKGCVVVSGMVTCGGAPLPIPPNSEESQAELLVRAHAFAFAKGISSFLTYCFRAVEEKPLDSEDYYGIVHKDLSPKPAYAAMRALTCCRPSGSTAVNAKWRSDDGLVLFPQWTRPDGKPAGMIWTAGLSKTVELEFEPGTVGFADIYGRRIEPAQTGDKYHVSVSGSPVYFRGRLKRVD